jgi:hypothetical protein
MGQVIPHNSQVRLSVVIWYMTVQNRPTYHDDSIRLVDLKDAHQEILLCAFGFCLNKYTDQITETVRPLKKLNEQPSDVINSNCGSVSHEHGTK